MLKYRGNKIANRVRSLLNHLSVGHASSKVELPAFHREYLRFIEDVETSSSGSPFFALIRS